MEMSQQELQLELLEKTVEYYKTNPRARDGEACKYIGPNGERCAVGRILPKRVCEEVEKKIAKSNEEDFQWENGISIPNLCKELELSQLSNEKITKLNQKYNVHYLRDLQHLHDDSDHWKVTDEGQTLTSNGESRVEQIRNSITKDNYSKIG
jgi:hypothetical protein